MQFQKGYIYHIYNQGNNRQKIFFNRENYFFFLRKIRTYILPYGDVLAWCLMPNHFHLMVLVREVEIEFNSESFTLSEALTTTKLSETLTTKRSFNHSVGILLRSYTRAINKQENKTGSLFRKETKAECINCFKGNTPSFIQNKINISNPEKQYPQICFDYIHQNPVKARFTRSSTDWEFSSARDYYSNRKGKLIAKTTAKEYLLIE